MDLMVILTVLISAVSVAFAYSAWRAVRKPRPALKSLPPGPKPYPLIGNILELGPKPHRSLAKLSKTYGPLIYLRLGALPTVVVSSPQLARLVLQTHDQVFAARTPPDAVRPLDHHKFSMVWLGPAQNDWRKLRKICKEFMFSSQSLDASQGLRREKLMKLSEYVHACCANGQAVNIGKTAFTTTLNLISSSLFSEELGSYESDAAGEFKEIVWEILEAVGTPNIADFFPVLRLVDPQRIFGKVSVHFKKFMEMIDGIIVKKLKFRRESIGSDTMENDMLDGLLRIHLRNEHELSIEHIKHLLLDLFVGGTDTSSHTVEWAMSELLRNPEKMLKARTELRDIVGKNEHVTESDTARLPYLRAVVKETFRLHPTAPLLVPHLAQQDIEIDGYTIPKDTRIFINAWSIGRDPAAWECPEAFMPERFLELDTDFRGQHFELIPFGSGRRICPGLPLANRMVHLMLATLIHNLDWKLDGGLLPQQLDMSDKVGISMQKVVPLKAIPMSVH